MSTEITLSTAQGQQATGLTHTEGQRSIAEVQAAVVMAKQFPRDMVQAMDRIKLACQRPTLAAAAVYAYSRGGSEVTGPSIRLAEAIAQQYGNLQFGIRELSQANGESTVEAFAWDMETNTRSTKTFVVPHTRYTKSKGNTKLADPRDIYERVANDGARRLRACILAVIPTDVVEYAMGECNDTLKRTVEVTPERIAAMVAMFATLNVTKAMIEKRIQRPVETVTPAMFVHLGRQANAIRDGIAKPGDFFEVTTEDRVIAPGTFLFRLPASQFNTLLMAVREGIATMDEVRAKHPNLVTEQWDALIAEVPKPNADQAPDTKTETAKN